MSEHCCEQCGAENAPDAQFCTKCDFYLGWNTGDGSLDGAPLTAAVETRFRHRSYASVLHLAFWPDGAEVVNTLDGRPCYPELATI